MLIGKNRVIRRRALVGLLVVASLALLTLSFRQGSAGLVGDIQRGALVVTAPFSAATHRVTQPFVDGWNWVSGLARARSHQLQLEHAEARASVLAAQNTQLRSQLAQAEALLHFKNQNPQFHGTAASVIAQSFSLYSTHVTIDAGSSQGIRLGDPVVAPVQDGAGLIGQVDSVAGSTAEVDLLTDPGRSVASRIQGSTARGLLQADAGSPGLFSLLQVSANATIHQGATVVTAGESGRLASIYPPGLLIGVVSSVQLSELSTNSPAVQVTPFVDFTDIQDVLVLHRSGP